MDIALCVVHGCLFLDVPIGCGEEQRDAMDLSPLSSVTCWCMAGLHHKSPPRSVGGSVGCTLSIWLRITPNKNDIKTSVGPF